MIRKILVVLLIVITCTAFSCGHTPQHSESMKEIIQMNVKMWEDLNSSKEQVKISMTNAVQLVGELDSAKKATLGARLQTLAAQEVELKKIDNLIPAIEGYEPKCNHEPGELHSHNNIDINGMSEKDLLEIHKELRLRLDKVQSKLSE